MVGTLSVNASLSEPQRREWQSLELETDPQLRESAMMAFAARQEAEGKLQLAAEIYQSLPQGRERWQALVGQGGLGNRTEFLLRNFAEQATDPSALIAMAATGALVQLTRLGMLTRLSQAVSPGFLTRVLGFSRLASIGAFAVEVPVFTLFHRWGDQVLGKSPDGDGSPFGRDLAVNYLVWGAMRVSGGLGLRLGEGQGRPLQSFAQQTGLFAGILLGHRLERELGLRDRPAGETLLADSLAMLLQVRVAGDLTRQLLGSEVSVWEQRAELAASNFAPKSFLHDPDLAWVDPGLRPSAAEELRATASILQMAGDDSNSPPSWKDRWRQYLPGWLGGGSRDPAPAEPSAELADPYRSQLFRFSTPREVRAEIGRLWGLVLNPRLETEWRSKTLADLQSLYRELRNRKTNYLPEIVAGEPSLRALVRAPQVLPTLPRGWPEILLEREIALPEEVAKFYRENLRIRSQAAHFLVDLHLEVLNHPNEIRKTANFLEETVRDPQVSAKFRTYFRQDIWLQSYREAEDANRQELFRAYTKLLPRLPLGSREAEQGFRLLTEKPLLEMATGKGPIPDYLTDPAWVLDLLRANANLLRLLPRSNEALQKADRALEPLFLSLGQRVREGDAAAIEVLGIFSRSDPTAKALLQQVAEQGDPNARKLLAKLP